MQFRCLLTLTFNNSNSVMSAWSVCLWIQIVSYDQYLTIKCKTRIITRRENFNETHIKEMKLRNFVADLISNNVAIIQIYPM